MELSSDFFQLIQEAVESAEIAFKDGDFDEAVDYMEQIGALAAECMQELEELLEGTEGDS
ncbi:MAG: hypothetical protein R6V46_07485 [Desulfatiglandaceae bacterium]|jgi:hypothetical protein